MVAHSNNILDFPYSIDSIENFAHESLNRGKSKVVVKSGIY